MRILCVHQGFELYGSDRCFLESVQVMRRDFPDAKLAVVLPRDGELAAAIAPFADELRFEPLWVLRKSTLLRRLPAALATLPLAVARAASAFRRHDLVYINTVTVLDYILAAAFFRHRALLHVHETPAGAIGFAFRALVRGVAVATIFNSDATRRAYRPTTRAAAHVVYNAVRGPVAAQPSDYDDNRPLRLLMVGRLSRGKGQDLLLDALATLPEAILKRIRLTIVGSAFGRQARLESELRGKADALGDSTCVRFVPFTRTPSLYYEWSDLVVIPSRVREGFGRVAVEAMAHARATIVAAHGGLSELVTDGVDGWWFSPGDPGALAKTILDAVAHPQHVRDYGLAGRRAYEVRFSPDAIERDLQSIIRRHTAVFHERDGVWPSNAPQLSR